MKLPWKVTRQFVDIREVNTNWELKPQHDDTFSRLLEQAVDGATPVYYAQVPLALCIPFDADYRPDLHEVGAAYIDHVKSEWQAGRFSHMVVYQRGRWFVVSDDYIPLFASLDGLPDFVPCWILGKPTGNDATHVQGPLDPPSVRKVLVPESGEMTILRKPDDL